MEAHQHIAQFEPRQWERRTTSLSQFARDIDEDLYNLDPEHQRDVVHNERWQGNIITSFIQFNDVPAVRFHAKPNQDGTRTFESLDGKQRCMAIYNFMTNVNTVNFDTVPQFADHRYGQSVTFDDLIPRHKHILANDVLIDIKIARDQFTEEEIAPFFQNAQEVKKTSLGEHLNSHINSPMRMTINHLLQHGDSFSPTFKNTRHSHLEMMARMAYAYYASRTPAIDKFDTTPAVLKKWWAESDGMLPDNFMNVVGLTITIINEGVINQKNSKATILPIYYYMLTDCFDVDGNIIGLAAARLSAALKAGLIVFDGVNGQHAASLDRYINLRELMTQIAATEVVAVDEVVPVE